jgi:hypothetical protein
MLCHPIILPSNELDGGWCSGVPLGLLKEYIRQLPDRMKQPWDAHPDWDLSSGNRPSHKKISSFFQSANFLFLPTS